MYLRRIQWMLKILFILFVFNQLQRVNCIHCGKFGFSCINEKCYRKCDVYKKSYLDNFVNLCPENTFCNEESKRACSYSSSNKNEDDQIKDIMSTQFSNKHKNAKPSSTASGSPSITATTSSTTCSPTTSSLPDNSKSIKKPPSPISAEKNALGKHGKCKTNSTKHNKSKSKHSRDVWNYIQPSFNFNNQETDTFENEMNSNKPNENSKVESSIINDISDYNELFLNSDSREQNDDTYNKNSRFRNTNNKTRQQFICPSVGSFPIKSDDSCFYVCFNRRRSTYTDLKAIKVCCPKSMYFNKISHRCENRSSQYMNWQRSRLRNRKFHRQGTYDRNRAFK